MGKYDNFKDVDLLNPEEVIKAINLALTTDEFKSNEERLYALGWILDRNKDAYINTIKHQVADLNKKKTTLEKTVADLNSKIEKLEKNVTNLEEIKAKLTDKLLTLKEESSLKESPQKKIVVVRKKPAS